MLGVKNLTCSHGLRASSSCGKSVKNLTCHFWRRAALILRQKCQKLTTGSCVRIKVQLAHARAGKLHTHECASCTRTSRQVAHARMCKLRAHECASCVRTSRQKSSDIFRHRGRAASRNSCATSLSCDALSVTSPAASPYGPVRYASLRTQRPHRAGARWPGTGHPRATAKKLNKNKCIDCELPTHE